MGKLYRLYPKIFNQTLLNATRAEAVLRASQPQIESNEEDVMSTEYIEYSR